MTLIASAADREERYRRYLRFTGLVRGGSVTPCWLDGGRTFWYAEGDGDERVIYHVDPLAGSRAYLFDGPRLQAALADRLGHDPPSNSVLFGAFTMSPDGRNATFRLDGRELMLELESYTIGEPAFLPSEAERARSRPATVRKGLFAGAPDVRESPSPNGRYMVGETEHNLTLRWTADGRSQPLTQDGTREQPWDVECVRWAPDSSRFVATHLDNRGVAQLPLVHWLKQVEEVEWIYYTKTDSAMPQSQLVVFEVPSGVQTMLSTGDERDMRLVPLHWSADDRKLDIMRLGRGIRPVTMLRADVRSGETQELLTEELAGLTPHTTLGPPVWMYTGLSDGRFIWLSARSGWSHLYLYDCDGHLVCPLTSGEFPVLQVIAVDEANDWVYFTANAEERIYDTNLYRVNLDGEGFQRLTWGEGQHALSFSPAKTSFIDTYSTPTVPPRVELRLADGTLVETLSEADISELEAIGWHPPEEFTALAADGKTVMHGLINLPADFNPEKRYPVINYVYGGPHRIITPHTFAVLDVSGNTHRGAIQRALAQLGFIVVVADGRGTWGRSQAFADALFGRFPNVVIPDQVAALKQLAATRPYMDMSRVGVFGISWGGYNTIRAMLTAPDIYHVGVATNPVADLCDHNASPAEHIMGRLSENREGYEAGSNLALAGRLEGKLLLVHATSDVNATFSATIKMVDALTRAGKPYDLMILPEQDHLPEGTSLGYWIEGIRRYFVEHLKP
jgi:dipeptidyl aminopeptidase/acylaminoacyl peptidase